MLFVSLSFIFIVLMLVPVVVTIPIHRKFGDSVPGKITLAWVALSVIFYILLLKGVGVGLDHFFPLVKNSATVCEVKTTYSRQGIN